MDRWQQIRRIFRGALAREGRERTAFLADACAGDDELRHQVDELLEEQGRATRFPEALSVEKVPATFSETAPRPSIGQRFAHYRIIDKLGAGGMGEVYRAHDEQLDRDVAIKLLPAASFADPTARARLLREARAAAALNHPHICTIHEVGEADGHTYIAMEVVEGQPLSARLEAGALPLEEMVRYGLQLAEALTHAHERGVLHRDLKSANIIITPEGRLKVLDFGLATRFTAEALTAVATQSHVSLTEPGVLMGTLAYMAPEQLRSQVADLRSDVWAFGVVLYEMMSGAHPFRASSSADTVSIILTKDPPPLERAAPAELQRIVGKCLEKDRERRYQTMRDLLIDLENAHRFSAKDAWRGYAAGGTAGASLKAAPLPIPRTPLVGRDHERMAARSLLLRPEVRLVTFTGTGGTGKTRLALQVAAELAPEFSGRVVLRGFGLHHRRRARHANRGTGPRTARDRESRSDGGAERRAGRVPRAGAARARQLRAGPRCRVSADAPVGRLCQPEDPRHEPRRASRVRRVRLRSSATRRAAPNRALFARGPFT